MKTIITAIVLCPTGAGVVHRLPVPRLGPSWFQQFVHAEAGAAVGRTVLNVRHGTTSLQHDRYHPAGTPYGAFDFDTFEGSFSLDIDSRDARFRATDLGREGDTSGR